MRVCLIYCSMGYSQDKLLYYFAGVDLFTEVEWARIIILTNTGRDSDRHGGMTAVFSGFKVWLWACLVQRRSGFITGAFLGQKPLLKLRCSQGGKLAPATVQVQVNLWSDAWIRSTQKPQQQVSSLDCRGGSWRTFCPPGADATQDRSRESWTKKQRPHVSDTMNGEENETDHTLRVAHTQF